MPKKKRGTPEKPGVVSLDDARKRRELEDIVVRLNELSKGMTDRVREIVGVYHEWEATYPEKAVSPGDKLTMVELGFVGALGYERCHEEDRVPGVAIWGEQSDSDRWLLYGDDESARREMCPALASGRCRQVVAAFNRPPCILLGAEIQQAIAPDRPSELTDAALDGDWRDPPEEEKKRFAQAKALVRKHKKLEEEAERRRPVKKRD